MDGSFINKDGAWWVVLAVDLARAFDWLPTETKLAINSDHASLYEGLKGETFKVEVLSFPVNFDERVRRLRFHEMGPKGFETNIDWQHRRQEEVDRTTNLIRSKNYGDRESRGFLLVKVAIDTSEDALLTPTQLAMLHPEKKFYITRKEHSGLIRPTQALVTRLSTRWGQSIMPATQAEVDVLMLECLWPGQREFARPLRRTEGSEVQDSHLTYFGRSNVRNCHPYEQEIDYYGSRSYVTCLPIAQFPISKRYIPDSTLEWAFQATSFGERIRYSASLTVKGGKTLLEEAEVKLSDVQSHSEYFKRAGGQLAKLNLTKQAAKQMYDYLANDGLVVIGRHMLVITADSEAKLADIREQVISTNAKARIVLAPDEDLQRRLYKASIPGAKELDRYTQLMDIDQASNAMPFVTTRPRATGPDYFGDVWGRELVPMTYGMDAPMREGATVSPTWDFVGPSRRGKTTFALDMVVPPIIRGLYIVLVADLLKGDLALVDISQLPDGLKVNFIDLAKHPGSLNPARLARNVGERQVLMYQFHRDIAGVEWEKGWSIWLTDACKYALARAERETSDGIPDQAWVYEWLSNPNRDAVEPDPTDNPDMVDIDSERTPGKIAHVVDRSRDVGARELGGLIERVSKTIAAPIFFSNASVRNLYAELKNPAMHILQQSSFVIPASTLPRERYTDDNNLAIAGLELASLLGQSVAEDRDTRVIMLTVEYSAVSKLIRGTATADYLARTGGALQSISAYDHQLPSDLDQDLANQVTCFVVFPPDDRASATTALKFMRVEPEEHLIRALLRLKGSSSQQMRNDDDTHRIIKGTALMRLPSGEVIAVRNRRNYIRQAFLTDANEKKPEKTA